MPSAYPNKLRDLRANSKGCRCKFRCRYWYRCRCRYWWGYRCRYWYWYRCRYRYWYREWYWYYLSTCILIQSQLPPTRR